MLLIDAATALSAKRLAFLNRRLAATGCAESLGNVQAFYLIHTPVAAPPPTLVELLGGATLREQPSDAVWVLPRFGTRSPWSSKAQDLLTTCGISNVARIERGLVFTVAGGTSDSWPPQAEQVIHDRMTESLLRRPPTADAWFQRAEPRPLVTVPLAADPLAALTRVNRDLGLALSAPELDYLARFYTTEQRDPTDAELMMFAQANSEHCRHKIFNAPWSIDGAAQPQSLFAMIRATHASATDGVLSAYSDNAAVVAGPTAARLMRTPATGSFEYTVEPVHLLMKVETHNHPTAIAPFAGAATGAGGEIRDEGATGLGAQPKAGLVGYTVSHLRLPQRERHWELPAAKPARIASPLDIMIDAPLGAAAFNNEFGRPNLVGYFRSFERKRGANARYGYHKPIMIAGGIGNVRDAHACKRDVAPGVHLIVLGGPAMLIGLGGGAASSMASGTSDAELDFASVQRGNPEMQRRAQEVITACYELGSDNPIALIHDVGAGGLSNAVPEAVDHSQLGATLELREVPNDEPAMSPMEIWCNESQERYVLLVESDRLTTLSAIAERERCPLADLGELNSSGRLVLTDRDLDARPVDVPLSLLLADVPREQRNVQRSASVADSDDGLTGLDLTRVWRDVLSHPTVASKAFLVTIGDRTVGGLTARDQMVGPWQVPVSDVAVTTTTHCVTSGEAMAMGERTPLACDNAPASGRMAIAEAITNLLAADVRALRDVRLSANWMAAAGDDTEEVNLYDTVKTVALDVCAPLGIAIPVGKDSLSMRTAWEGGTVSAPVSLIVSAFAPVADVRRTLTPELQRTADPTVLVLLDIGAGQDRVGGSVLAEVTERSLGAVADLDDPTDLQSLAAVLTSARDAGWLLAYHDRSDGGVFTAVAEMMFAGRCGVTLDCGAREGQELLRFLFAEELGVLVQVRRRDTDRLLAVCASNDLSAAVIGSVDASQSLTLDCSDGDGLVLQRSEMQAVWSEVSDAVRELRDNPACVAEERERIHDDADPGLAGARWSGDLSRAPVIGGQRPRVAILREQGVNSQAEMAAAFVAAGFEAIDVHMSDLAAGRQHLDDFHGFAACGGFSYGDVLGAGGGWAGSILHDTRLADQFAAFLQHPQRFALGVCNGCQMVSRLKSLIPGAAPWPTFTGNRSERFEARLSLVEIAPTDSWLLDGMAGQRLPVATSHAEGRATFASDAELATCQTGGVVAARYIDGYGRVTMRYPANPNGSPDGISALTAAAGRVTVIMPHPERVARAVCHSWYPPEWPDTAPWTQLFANAYRAVS
ncbi:MAG: phosphoribosylformylglycinamidine synthase [Pseudomonadota bacterium]